MTHIRHHLSWLLRRFRAALILNAAVWAVLAGAVWLVHDDGKEPLHANGILTFFHAVLPVLGLLIFVEALRQDAAPGTGEFWRTRPPRWRAVCCSQATFALVFVGGPPLLVWFINGLRLHNTALQWRYAMLDALLIVAPLFALAGVVSFSRRWYGMLLGAVFTAGCFIAGFLLSHYWPVWLRVGGETDGRFFVGSFILAGALVLTFCWVMGMRRPGVVWRVVFAGAGLVAGPMLMSNVNLSGVRSEPLVLTATFEPAGRPGVNGGILKIEGVPEDCLALIRDSKGMQLSHQRPDAGPSEEKWSPPVPVMPNLPFSQTGHFLGIPDAPLRALLPGNVHWYSNIVDKNSWSDGSHFAGSLDSVLSSAEYSGAAVKIKMSGTVEGYLLSAVRLASLNLENEARAAENGTRLLMRRFSLRENGLSMTVEMWRSAGFSGPTDPAGLQIYHGFYEYPCLPVLYFPALRMAVLTSPGSAGDEFRSWQCTNRFLSISTLLPSAEIIRGVRFTPETLRGAQLVLCVPVLKGHFTLAAPEGTHTLTTPPDEESKAKAILRELNDTSFDQFSPPGEWQRKLIKDLLQMGPSGLRAMLRYDWDRDGVGPLQGPSAAMDLWRPLTDEFLPDLRAAARHDHRWVNVARLIGKEEALVPDALDAVRRSDTPLASVVVTIAALGAKREDYDKLRHHAAIAFQKDYFTFLLWRRLRVLPDFPWRELARRLWREGYEQYEKYEHPPLCAAAALAGETSALNDWLEGHWIGHDEILDPAEWDELLAMIEGVPPRSAAPDWLRKNRGNFLWDEALGKYRVQN